MITDQNGYLVNKSNTYSHSSPVDLQSVISMEILESDAPYMDACNHEVGENTKFLINYVIVEYLTFEFGLVPMLIVCQRHISLKYPI